MVQVLLLNAVAAIIIRRWERFQRLDHLTATLHCEPAASSLSPHFRRIDLVGTKVRHADLKVTYFPVEGMDGTGWVITFLEQVRCEYATGCSNHYVCTNTLIVTQLEPYCLRLIDSPPVLLALKVFNLATSSSNLASISWITFDCFIVLLYSQQTIDKM